MASVGGYSDPADPIDKIVQLAMLRFGVHKIEVSQQYGSRGAETVLVDPTGRQYALKGLISHATQVPVDSSQFYQVIMGHVDAIVNGTPPPTTYPGQAPATEFPPPSIATPTTGAHVASPFNGMQPPSAPSGDLGAMFSGAPPAGQFPAPPAPAPAAADPLASVVRVRLVPDTLPKTMSLGYARPFATGLVSVLSDPNNPAGPFLSDSDLQGKDINGLFNAGYGNLMAEKFTSVTDVAPDVRLFVGDSPCTASKAIGMGMLVGTDLPPAPYGVVFGVPHQHLLYAHVVTGTELIHAVNALATLVVGTATADAPGGVLSNLTYFWNGGVVEPIGFPNTEGKVQIVATGAFGKMLNEVMR